MFRSLSIRSRATLSGLVETPVDAAVRGLRDGISWHRTAPVVHPLHVGASLCVQDAGLDPAITPKHLQKGRRADYLQTITAVRRHTALCLARNFCQLWLQGDPGRKSRGA